MQRDIQDSFLSLIRSGLELSDTVIAPSDWNVLRALAIQQELFPVVLDGIEKLSDTQRPQQATLVGWIGEVLHCEGKYELQSEVAKDLAKFYHTKGIKTYVLKGTVVSECYPKPNHRVSSDIDCFLAKESESAEMDAWSLGNELIRNRGFRVNVDFYKNSSFEISEVNIENHRFFTPFRGNKRLKGFEEYLQSQIKADAGVPSDSGSKIGDTFLYRPPVMASALFLIEHAYSHFLHEGLTWRHVLDWMMFRRRHKEEINWLDFETRIDEFGFRKFYDSYFMLGRYLLGEVNEKDLNELDRQMLQDVWAPLDLHETARGLKGKLALAGNTWRARWKYRRFTDMSWATALWIQVKGYLFIKHPTLN